MFWTLRLKVRIIGAKEGMQAIRTPRLISTIDHSMIGSESVYTLRREIVRTRMAWTIVMKKPRANSAPRTSWIVSVPAADAV